MYNVQSLFMDPAFWCEKCKDKEVSVKTDLILITRPFSGFHGGNENVRLKDQVGLILFLHL